MMIIAFAIGLIACGSDSLCTTDTVVGTYTGTNECPAAIQINEADVGDIELTIRHIEADNYVAVYTSGATVGFELNGCMASLPDEEATSPGGVKIETSGEGNFTGDNFTLNIRTIVDGVEFTCSASVTKS